MNNNTYINHPFIIMTIITVTEHMFEILRYKQASLWKSDWYLGLGTSDFI